MTQRKIETLALFLLIPLALSFGAAACRQAPAAAPVQATAPAPPSSTPTSPASSPAAVASSRASGPVVVFLGDSLTAGLGLGEEQAYPARVAVKLAAQGTPVKVINAGVSGDTTAGGLARIDWLLRQHPDVLVVGLGGNDGLRGLPLAATEKNLRDIIRRGQASGVRVLLLGMQIPPNYGPDYVNGFKAMYPRLAKEMNVPLVPFLLEGVGGVADLNQNDGIHPTAQGQEMVADNVVPYLAKLLAKETATAKK
ncbi:MAG TPA: arylesterase [Thermoanaerobaculia bacterium]|nr:arylesterase [Thermoanaerobaculia bacterium]